MKKYINYSKILQGLAKFGFLFPLAFSPLFGQVSVLTQHNDNARSGQNLNETILTAANVNVNEFGKRFTCATDDQVYGQPIIFAGNGINYLYAATVNNTVYCFNADTGAKIWTRNFGTAARRSDNSAFNCPDIVDKFGIVGTPVIDPVSLTLYVASLTNDGGGVFKWRLHALGLGAGEEKFGGPVVITTNGFDSLFQNQRPALLVSKGKVYIAFSSHCDSTPYHGYIFAYNTTTLAQEAVFNDTPSGSQGAIWMAGQGPAADASGNVYFLTGNGSWDGKQNFGESLLKLNPNLGLVSWFTPSDWNNLNKGDQDFGASGCLLIPGTSLAIGGGKSGILYLLNTGNLGGISNGDTGAVQHFQVVFPNSSDMQILGSPVYFNSPTNGPTMYVWGDNDHGHAYKLVNGKFQTPAFMSTAATAPVVNGPGKAGGSMSISAHGNANGILWAYTVYSGNANDFTEPGILHAYDANNLNTELWNSRQNNSRDSTNNLGKYTSPTIANGKVYISSFGNQSSGQGSVEVYGLVGGGGGRSEVENLPETHTAGVSYVINSDPAASNGKWGELVSTAVGQFVEYTVGGIVQGTTYQITIGYKKNTSRGQCALTINGSAHGNLDQYSPTGVFTSAVLNNFDASSPGTTALFRFTVTGKNSASSGFTLGFDYITLTPL